MVNDSKSHRLAYDRLCLGKIALVCSHFWKMFFFLTLYLISISNNNIERFNNIKNVIRTSRYVSFLLKSTISVKKTKKTIKKVTTAFCSIHSPLKSCDRKNEPAVYIFIDENDDEDDGIDVFYISSSSSSSKM